MKKTFLLIFAFVGFSIVMQHCTKDEPVVDCNEDQSYFNYKDLGTQEVDCNDCNDCALLSLALCEENYDDIEKYRTLLSASYNEGGYIPCPELVPGTYGIPIPKDGQGVFWVSEDFGCGDLSVFVEDEYLGDITLVYSSEPDCDASGCVSFSNTPGFYNFIATCGDWEWGGQIEIIAGVCSTMQLTSKKKVAR